MTHKKISTGNTVIRQLRWLEMKFPCIFLLVLLTLGSTLVTPVRAEHEVDHRYEIEGYILDESGEPVSSTNVTIRIRDSIIGSAETAGDGYYSIRAHLHDENLGQQMSITAGGLKFQTRVTFRRGDTSTERIHYINNIGGQWSEKKLPRRRIPGWVFALAGGIIAIAALVFFRPEIQKLRRRFKPAPAPVPGNTTQPSKRIPKKKRRKR